LPYFRYWRGEKRGYRERRECFREGPEKKPERARLLLNRRTYHTFSEEKKRSDRGKRGEVAKVMGGWD